MSRATNRGIHSIQVDGIVRHIVVPAAVYNLAIAENRRIQIMTLVKRYLLDAASVVIHNVKVERKFVVIFVLCCESLLAFVEQQGLRLMLTRR